MCLSYYTLHLISIRGKIISPMDKVKHVNNRQIIMHVYEQKPSRNSFILFKRYQWPKLQYKTLLLTETDYITLSTHRP